MAAPGCHIPGSGKTTVARRMAEVLHRPGMSSRSAHDIDFPDDSQGGLLQIGQCLPSGMNCRFGDGARATFGRYPGLRLAQPHFANARNALDRARLRQASRLCADRGRVLAAMKEARAATAGRASGNASAPGPGPAAKAGQKV